MGVERLFDLTGRVAIVTGASSGIGAAIGRVFAEAGCAVALVARRADRLAELVSELTSEGLTAYAIAADLGEQSDVDRIVPEVIERFGHLDILVNNAARDRDTLLVDLDRAELDWMIDVNLWAPIRLCQLAHPYLAASDAAAIVNIGSVDGTRPSAGAIAYGATKAGLTAMTVALAKEWSADGIRVNIIEPGLIRTEMAAPLIEQAEAAGINVNPARTFGEPEQIAAMALYLASPAGRFTTGTTYRVDGGALISGPFDMINR
jgi:NAD(P)-dependent dehydrogenase (short-subunit alcohol dehydrogenase family)